MGGCACCHVFERLWVEQGGRAIGATRWKGKTQTNVGWRPNEAMLAVGPTIEQEVKDGAMEVF
jgi:hypothetical protein